MRKVDDTILIAPARAPGEGTDGGCAVPGEGNGGRYPVGWAKPIVVII